MSRPIFFHEITRYGDGVAFVKITRATPQEDGGYSYKEVAGYETLSRGATASARREIKKLEKEA